tara:strand:- start:274 stop:591 length:318 start_codon:yes stop_codon:yes gene_type:complete
LLHLIYKRNPLRLSHFKTNKDQRAYDTYHSQELDEDVNAYFSHIHIQKILGLVSGNTSKRHFSLPESFLAWQIMIWYGAFKTEEANSFSKNSGSILFPVSMTIMN